MRGVPPLSGLGRVRVRCVRVVDGVFVGLLCCDPVVPWCTALEWSGLSPFACCGLLFSARSSVTRTSGDVGVLRRDFLVVWLNWRIGL